MSNCGQACPYNTLNGCKVKEYNGTCPLTNMALADFEAVKDAKPQTNADHIRAMSDEELAKFLQKADFYCKGDCEKCLRGTACIPMLQWLKQPAKDGE